VCQESPYISNLNIMKRQLIFLSLIFLICNSCSKDVNVDNCAGLTYDIQYSSKAAVGGTSNGSITVLYPRGDTLKYAINNGTAQESPIFSGLAAGNYIVKVINQKGCSDTVQLIIQAYGAKYAAVKQLVTGYCGPCHLNGGASGGKNLDTDSSIVTSWDRIRVRCVNGLPTFMPQNGQLTTIDKQKITDWVNAGHRLTD
jgi:hypothetical protein